MKDREQQARGTSEFIDAQLGLAKKALEQAEESIGTAKSKGDRAVAILMMRSVPEALARMGEDAPPGRAVEWMDWVVSAELVERGRANGVPPATPGWMPNRSKPVEFEGWPR